MIYNHNQYENRRKQHGTDCFAAYDAADKLRAINRGILLQYGSQKAKIIMRKLTGAIGGLENNEEIDPSVEEMFGVPCDYRYLLGF